MALTVPTVAVGDDVLASWANAAKAAIDDLYSVVTDTTIGTAAAGWSVNSGGQIARTALGGKLIYVTLYLQRAAALTATAGNVGDETMFTLDAAYRPAEVLNAPCGTGTETGEAAIYTTGLVQIRTLSDSAAAAANYRCSFSFLLP